MDKILGDSSYDLLIPVMPSEARLHQLGCWRGWLFRNHSRGAKNRKFLVDFFPFETWNLRLDCHPFSNGNGEKLDAGNPKSFNGKWLEITISIHLKVFFFRVAGEMRCFWLENIMVFCWFLLEFLMLCYLEKGILCVYMYTHTMLDL